MEDIVIVEPAFFSQFRCVGSDCIDHCCKGWDIEIDKSTVQRYMQSDELKIRQIAVKDITITEKKPDSWGRINLTSSGNCAFLDEERLCKVHKHLGEKALSTTCALYPRIYSIYKYEIRSNLTLSCPEATKRLLLTPQAMLYSEKVKQSPQVMEGPDILQEDRLLNLMSTNIMSSCGMNIEEGFYGIIMLLLFRDEQDESDLQYENLLTYFEEVQTSIGNGQIKKNIDALHSDYQLQSSLLMQLQQYLSTKNEGRGSSVLRHYSQALIDLKSSISVENECINPVQQLNKIWQEKALPWLQQRPYLLSNFIQYKMYEEFFPVKNGTDPFTSTYALVSEWLLLKWLIAISFETNNNFNEDDIINIIYSYHSITKHDKHAADMFLSEIQKIILRNNSSLLYLLK